MHGCLNCERFMRHMVKMLPDFYNLLLDAHEKATSGEEHPWEAYEACFDFSDQADGGITIDGNFQQAG
jgi:hypothetical protein